MFEQVGSSLRRHPTGRRATLVTYAIVIEAHITSHQSANATYGHRCRAEIFWTFAIPKFSVVILTPAVDAAVGKKGAGKISPTSYCGCIFEVTDRYRR